MFKDLIFWSISSDIHWFHIKNQLLENCLTPYEVCNENSRLVEKIHLMSFRFSQSKKLLKWRVEPRFCVIWFKGTVSWDFRHLVFFHESISPKPLSIPLGPFRISSKIREDICRSWFTTGVTDTGGKWKKSSIIKVLIILFGQLWEVELT